jgi:hypothetical protein
MFKRERDRERDRKRERAREREKEQEKRGISQQEETNATIFSFVIAFNSSSIFDFLNCTKSTP